MSPTTQALEREDVAPERRRRPLPLVALVVFLVIGSVLWVVVQVSHDHLPPENPKTGPELADAAWIGGWLQYDTGWYVYLAEHGYDRRQVDELKAGRQSAVAYFPGYPMTVRGVSKVTGGDAGRAAQLTTVVSGLAAVVVFALWCRRRLPPSAQRTAVVLLCVYPYAWYLYGSGYGDAMFLALTLAAFVLVERDRPVLGGLAGAAAAATRLIGVGTGLGLMALVLERRHAFVATDARGTPWWQPWRRYRLDRSRLRPGDAGVLLSFTGLLGYMAFLWARTGDALAFKTVEAAPGWDQGTGLKTIIHWNFFAQVLRGDPSYGIRLVAHALVFLLFAIAVPFVWKRIGPAYALYTTVLLLIPGLGSGSLQGTGRYLLAAFPVFALGGQVLSERARLRAPVLALSALALVVMASFFGRGYYLS